MAILNLTPKQGQSIIYEPNTFMAHDVVMVVIQYRLGPLGKIF